LVAGESTGLFAVDRTLPLDRFAATDRFNPPLVFFVALVAMSAWYHHRYYPLPTSHQFDPGHEARS